MGGLLSKHEMRCVICGKSLGYQGWTNSTACDECYAAEDRKVVKCPKCNKICPNGRECNCNDSAV